MLIQRWSAEQFHAHAVVACCGGAADTGRSTSPPFCSHTPRAAQQHPSQLSNLGIPREKGNYSRVTLSRFSSWSWTMGSWACSCPLCFLLFTVLVLSCGCSRSLRSHHPGCPICAQGHTATMSDAREGEPESDHLKEKWEQGRRRVPWDAGLRALPSKLQASCHPYSSMGDRKPRYQSVRMASTAEGSHMSILDSACEPGPFPRCF